MTLEIVQRTRKKRPDIYLTPASNSVATQNLEKAVLNGGINLAKFEQQIKDLYENLEEIYQRLRKYQEEYRTKEEQIAEIQQEKEEIRREFATRRAKREQTGNASESEPIPEEVVDNIVQSLSIAEIDSSRFDKLKKEEYELESERESLQKKIGNARETIENTLATERELINGLHEMPAGRSDEDVSSYLSTLETALEHLEQLRGKYPDSISLWAVRDSVGQRHDFCREDALLFYTGDKEYRAVGFVDASFNSKALSEVLWEGAADNDFSKFILFQKTQEVYVDSSQIATLAGHNIDYVIGFARLNDEAKKALFSHYGSNYIEKFVQDMEKSAAEDMSSHIEALLVEATQDQYQIDGQAPLRETQKIDDIEDPDFTPLTGFAEIATHIEHSKLVVLCGPAQTGKLPGMRLLFQEWFDEEKGALDLSERIMEINFRPGMDHLSFVESDSDRGYPTIGPFRQFCDRVAADSWQTSRRQSKEIRYATLIDSFNRADPSAVFGPVWSILPENRRGRENRIELQNSGAPFWLPKSLYIIGCVDTNECPISDLPATVRDKFRILRTEPDYDILRNAYGFESQNAAEQVASEDTEKGFIAASICALERLNDLVINSDQLDANNRIGHLALLETTPRVNRLDATGIRYAWRYDILGRLMDYYEETPSTLWKDTLADYETDSYDADFSTRQQSESFLEELIRELADDA
jgi:hypothetical protein